MGIFDGYLFVSDFDGTFADYEQVIPPQNLEAVDYFMAEGGRFALATGRSLPGARGKLEHLRFNAPFVLCNGSLVYDFETEEVLWANEMPESAARMAAELKRDFPDVGMEIFKGAEVYLTNETEATDRHIRKERLRPVRCEVEEVPSGYQKIMLLAPHERLLEVERWVLERPHYQFDFVFPEPHYYEGLDASINKAAGLRQLAAHLGIPMERVLAVGDYYNDLQMLREAGIGACVAAAPYAVKEVCDWVLCDVKEGAVAEAVRRLEMRLRERKIG